MEPATFSQLYISLLLLQTAVTLGIDTLNIRQARSRSSAIPPQFKDLIDSASYSKSVAYTLEKNRLSMLETAVSSLTLLSMVTSGVLGSLDSFIARMELSPYLHGVICIFSVGAILGSIELPLKLYRIFSIEERYGFNTMSLTQWINDLVKGTVLNLVLLTPLIIGVLWFMEVSGSLWWLYAFCFVAAFQLLLMFIFPVFIAPIFNKFSPLPPGDLHTSINALADRLAFKCAGILVMDGSRRSAHANAYFTGFGKNRRIVLFDTLLENLSIPQTLAVLAHEIGHAKLQHIPRMLLLSLGLSFGGFWLLSRMLSTPAIFTAFGFAAPSHHAALLVMTFATTPVTFFLSPIVSALSRRHEYQADEFAARAVASAAPMSEALLALSKKSLSNLTPHPWYSFFHYSHPTLLERLQALAKIPLSSGSSSN